jgi:nucleotide-binding universal stress UspA family protein
MSWFPRQKVVVPVDFSASSAPALRTALELTAASSGVHAVYVIPPLNPVSPIGIWSDAEAEQQLSEKALLHLQTFLASHECEGVHASVQIGEPGACIVEYADQHNADLIIIPSHGYRGLKRALLGSVAERVIRYANVPTLVLRREEAD